MDQTVELEKIKSKVGIDDFTLVTPQKFEKYKNLLQKAKSQKNK